jgi:iron complex transport system permease protein
MKNARTLLVLVGLLVLSIIAATALGGAGLPLGRTFSIVLSGLFGGDDGAAAWERAIVLTVRLPRVLLAALTGASLATAGAAMQALFRNPMADPGILGISSGAALGAVIALYAGAAAAAFVTVPLAAFAGALGCAGAVYAISTSRGRTPVTTLLLCGIAVGGIAGAMTSLVLSLSLADWEVGSEMLRWLMGGLDGRSWPHLALAAPIALGGSIWLGAYARDLDALLTGEESAMAVGVDVPRVKRTLLLLASLVTAATVAVTGVIGFVGLMVPHAVRLVTGPSHARLVPASFLAGGIFLVWADALCRALPETDLRLGVVTAATGGPFFLFLLVRRRAREERA